MKVLAGTGLLVQTSVIVIRIEMRCDDFEIGLGILGGCLARALGVLSFIESNYFLMF